MSLSRRFREVYTNPTYLFQQFQLLFTLFFFIFEKPFIIICISNKSKKKNSNL